MKKYLKIKTTIIILVVFMLSSGSYYYLVAYPGGISGRTLKTSTAGCSGSGCHTSSTSVTSNFSEPDSVIKGTKVQFIQTIAHTNTGGMGTDIAVRLGTLAPGASSADLYLLSGELTHSNPFTTSPKVLNFNYTAPSNTGIDTLFGTAASGHAGAWAFTPSKRIVVKNTVGTGIENQTTPAYYSLSQNFPNPFNPNTKIEYQIPKNTKIILKVYDELGSQIAVLVNGLQEAGNYSVNFDASKYASGIYYYKINAGDFEAVKKMMLIK